MIFLAMTLKKLKDSAHSEQILLQVIIDQYILVLVAEKVHIFRLNQTDVASDSVESERQIHTCQRVKM